MLEPHEDTSHRECSLCKTLKSCSEFHLKGADAKGKARYQSSCKECANKKRMQRYEDQKKKAKKTRSKEEMRAFRLEIVYDPVLSNNTDMKEIMSDFIEAVYASAS